ncbi:MAG: MarR family winged helix-turn-helix transcriptional regulator [Chitinophagales bacterium]
MRLEDEIQQSKFEDEYHKLMVNLMFTGSWLSIRQIQFFRNYDISPQQFNILRILRGQFPKPASVNLLIERMLDKMSNASRLVDKLYAKKLVERKKNKEDGRQVDVLLSKKGFKLLEQIDKDIRIFEANLNKLEKNEAALLSDLLDKMRG